MLIESLGYSKLDYIIIGIGINVNQIDFDYLNSKATSMKHKIKTNTDVEKVLEIFINNYNDILKSNYDDLFNEYLKSSVVINKNIFYREEEFKIIDIEHDGTIIIKNKFSEQRVAYSEISLKEFY